jgi:hypothetical protein
VIEARHPAEVLGAIDEAHLLEGGDAGGGVVEEGEAEGGWQ